VSTELSNDKKEIGSKGQYQNLNIMELFNLAFCTEIMTLVEPQYQN